MDAVLESEGGKSLFVGKVADIERRTTKGFLRGAARIAGLGPDRGATMELRFQNEFAVAFRDGEPVAMTPEILCVVDSATGEALGTEVIAYGQRVRVIALDVPAVLKTERGLRHVGPRALGYDLDFRPLFPEPGPGSAAQPVPAPV